MVVAAIAGSEIVAVVSVGRLRALAAGFFVAQEAPEVMRDLADFGWELLGVEERLRQLEVLQQTSDFVSSIAVSLA